MVQQPDPSSVALESHMASSLGLSCSTLNSTLCLWAGKAVEDSSSPRAPGSMKESQQKLLASSFRSGSASAIGSICRVNQQIEDNLSPSLSSLLPACFVPFKLSFKKVETCLVWWLERNTFKSKCQTHIKSRKLETRLYLIGYFTTKHRGQWRRDIIQVFFNIVFVTFHKILQFYF